MLTASESPSAASSKDLSRQQRRTVLLAVAAFWLAIGLFVAFRDLRNVLYDDAAITMRYADRIAHGEGFTYNPGDRTNGASSPLYALLLAVMTLVGAPLVASAKVIGVACYAATVSGASWLAGRIAGVVAAIIAPLLLLLSMVFRRNVLSGMESGLASLLGVLTIVALNERRYVLTGVLLGLSLFNKLDAAALAVGVGTALLIANRKALPRVIWVSAAVFAPWVVFSQLYFGSVLPNSAAAKLGPLAEGTKLDPTWMWSKIMVFDGYGWVAVLAIVAVVFLGLVRQWRDFSVVLALLGWSLLHVLAFSLVNLGGAYEWYATAAYPGLVIAGAVGLGSLVGDLWDQSVQGRRRTAARIAAVLLIAVPFVPLTENVRALGTVVAHGHVEDAYESFERTRMQTGYYLERHAAPGDVLETCFGWPAFLARQTVIKETCPLSTRKPVGEPLWKAEADFPGNGDVAVPKGWTQVFTRPGPEGGRSWVLERD